MIKQIFTVGNMVSIPTLDKLSMHDSSNNILFVGKMSYEPNIIAVTFFSNEVFPDLKKTFPNLDFLIVGANPSKRVKSLETIEGIHVTGYVENLEPFFQKATIVVAPMLTGAGIQNKIIQAMSYGCCVVTTPIGAEGLEITNNAIKIIKDEHSWVEILTKLLNNKDEREKMGHEAYKYVCENLSRKTISEQFWKFINAPLI